VAVGINDPLMVNDDDEALKSSTKVSSLTEEGIK